MFGRNRAAADDEKSKSGRVHPDIRPSGRAQQPRAIGMAGESRRIERFRLGCFSALNGVTQSQIVNFIANDSNVIDFDAPKTQ